MRIIAGIAKGRKIKAPEGMNTRPTLDRVKESLFNIVNPYIFEADVLDLFGGSGQLGLEAVSRGAAFCTFTEHNKNSYSVLKENISNMGFENKTEALNIDALEGLAMLHRKGKTFDLIFLDPPYFKFLIDAAVTNIDKYKLLSPDGIITSEYDFNEVVPDKIGNLVVFRKVKYGRTKISLWRWDEAISE